MALKDFLGYDACITPLLINLICIKKIQHSLEVIMRRWMLLLLAMLWIAACGKYTLQKAVGYQNYNDVRQFIEKGAGIDNRNKEGWTTLIYASYYGNLPLVKILVSRGAKLDTQNNEGWTALIYAAYCGHDEIAKYLVNQGANVDLINQYGYSAMGYAQQFQHTALVDFLAAHGAKYIN